MKAAICLSLCLLSVALAGYNPLIENSGRDILHALMEGNHNHYVLQFYMPAEESSHLGYRNEKMLEEVRREFLDKN